MKQLLSLFLFLFPCLALAQYPSNGNQKITLGEQTTADGLIYRGVLGDTALITPSSDTSAYIILDTVNHRFYNYNRATNVWSVAGGGTAVTTFSAGSTGLTPSDATSGAVTLGGTLAVANGGTNLTTLGAANRIPYAASTTALTTSDNLTFDGTVLILRKNSSGATFATLPNISVENTNTGTNSYSSIGVKSLNNGVIGDLLADGFGNIISGGGILFRTFTNHPFLIQTNATNRLMITANGNFGFGTTTPQSGYRLHVVDSVYVGGNVSAAAYTTRSDYNLKDDIFDLKYGLNDVLKLKPVEYTYKSNGSKQLGFIAQDIGTILPEVVSFEESMSVNYQAIIPILTKAIQEQNLLIKALEQRIFNLENK
jgi:hypothetical protein